MLLRSAFVQVTLCWLLPFLTGPFAAVAMALPIGGDPAAAWRAGPAAGYSAYLFAGLDYSYSDSQGALFVGGNARLSDYRVGDVAPADLVVKGTLDFHGGYVTGDIRNDAPTLDRVGLGGRLLPSGVDDTAVAAARAYYQSLSAFWAAGDPVGSLSRTPWGAFSLSAGPGINVFTLSDPLIPYNRFDLFLDEDATVIINLRGDGLALHDLGFYLNGHLVDEYQDPGVRWAERIFFNFPDARELILGCIAPFGSCGGIGLPGHVLAPWAAITAVNGQLIGDLVANALSDGGLPAHYGRFQFNGIPISLPPTPALFLAGVLTMRLAGVGRRGLSLAQGARLPLSLAFAIVAAVLIVLAVLPLDTPWQAWLAWSSVALLLPARFWPRRGWARLLFLTLTALVVLRYLGWRTYSTLHFHDLPSYLAALLLYAAEWHGVLLLLLSAFVNVRPIVRRAAPLPAREADWPTVDVLITTYDEDPELVRITLVAATAIDYPKDRVRIYLLDDGASEARLNEPDAARAAAARARQAVLRAYCAEHGARYLNRADNRGAKSGNLNAALARTEGELLLILDADHVPARDILRQTVGFFVRDARLFLVQTPHFFLNPDPIEKNLGLEAKMPPENAMFYGAIQPGLDFWQSSFFCGSAAVLRRQALNEIGGFAGDSITEDAETAMLLHGKGWRSVYWDRPLVAGLQPDTFTSFIIQRMRWAQGMVQIFRLHNPLWGFGLKPWQRLAYLSNMLFWLFPLARVVYLLAPLFFLIFDWRIYDATLTEIVVYTLPYLLASSLKAHYLFGRWRWPLVSDIYETMQSLFSLPAVLRALRDPRSPRFQVTPKLEQLEEDFVSPLAKPFYALTGLLLAGGLWGGVRLWHEYDGEKAMLLLVGLVWLTINLAIVLAAVGALLERRQRRRSQRVRVDLAAEWWGQGVRIPLRMTDVSLGGAQGICPLGAFQRPPALDGVLHLPPDAFHTRIINWREERGHYVLGLAFTDCAPQEYRRRVLLVYGDSTRWAHLLRKQSGQAGFVKASVQLLAAGFVHAVRHVFWLFWPRAGVAMVSSSLAKPFGTSKSPEGAKNWRHALPSAARVRSNRKRRVSRDLPASATASAVSARHPTLWPPQ